MDFFAQQAKARTSTTRLLVMFGLAVSAIVVAIDSIVLVAIAAGSRRHSHGDDLGGSLIAAHSGALIATTLIVLAVIALASLYKSAQLAGGGGAVAVQLGGKLVADGSTDFAERRLRNIVEEVAIASGVPVPEIYVLEHEDGINAFAAGFTPSDAAVAVTRGALERLTRDELQGVIAHEFSHILNGDMRLNIRLMGVLFGILVLGIIGREVASSGSNSRDGAAIAVFGLVVMAIGFIGLFFGRLIKASVSRQREYLADASAVQFTRDPSGIAGALKKIGGLSAGSTLAARGTEEVSHMLFGDGVGYGALFASHPSLVDRIRRIEPRFDPRELVEINRRWSDLVAASEDDPNGSLSGMVPRSLAGGGPTAAAAALSGLAPAPAAPPPRPAPAKSRAAPPPLPGANARVAMTPKAVANQVANPAEDDYRSAHHIGTQVPAALLLSARMIESAPAVVLALALNSDPTTRARQVELIGAACPGRLADDAAKLAPAIDQLHPMLRLPLAAIAFPAIRRRPRPFLLQLVAALQQVIHADGVVELSEYCLAKLVSVQVIEALDPSSARVAGRRKLAEVTADVAILLAVLAHAGQDQPESAQRAYAAGCNGLIAGVPPAYRVPENIPAALDLVLANLDQLNLQSKEMLIEALVRTMAFDGAIAVAEAEVLRTICAALHCPLPPMLADLGQAV